MKFTLAHAKVLYLRFCVIYQDKFVKSYHTEDFKKLWESEWCSGLGEVKLSSIKPALDECKIRVEWPPSVAEFLRICERVEGLPSCNEAMALAIRRDLSHPIVSMAYTKIGAWAMSHDRQEVLMPKFKDAYDYARSIYYQNPAEAHKQLEAAKEEPPEQLPPPKTLTSQEKIDWRGRLAQYKRLSAQAKEKANGLNHQTWDKAAVTLGHRGFDEKIYKERREYLVSLDETSAIGLNTDDKYDRICYLRENEAQHAIKISEPIPGYTKTKKTNVVPFKPSKVAYKDWMN